MYLNVYCILLYCHMENIHTCNNGVEGAPDGIEECIYGIHSSASWLQF